MPIWRGTGFPRQYPRGPAGPFSLKTVHWTVFRALEPPSDLPEIASIFRAANLQGSDLLLYAPRLLLRKATIPMGLSVGLWPTADGRFCESSAAPPVAGFGRVLLRCACGLSPLRGRYRSTGSLPQKSPRCRRACRRQRLKHGALPPPNPLQVSQGTASDISDFLVR